jgi:Holliday junction DNA helicase RuvB
LDHEPRLHSLADFVGQQRITDRLVPLIETAKRYDKPLDHMLLSGLPGFGKATLAEGVAAELGGKISRLSGRTDQFLSDWVPILVGLKTRDVLVVDEIHLIRKDVEDFLYRAIGEFVVTWEVGRGRGTKEAELALERFTLIGVSSRLSALSTRMRERIGTTFQFQSYDLRAMAVFLVRFARDLAVAIEPEGAVEIARRSRGTPLVADRLLRLVRDYAVAQGDGMISADVASEALAFMKVDKLGLDENDRRYLSTVIETFGGGPVGLPALAEALGEYPDAVADAYEPYLIRLGFLARTSKGRTVTVAGHEYLRA